MPVLKMLKAADVLYWPKNMSICSYVLIEFAKVPGSQLGHDAWPCLDAIH